MRSNYKTLGPYIRELKNRNRDGAVSDLRGVSIGKDFISSVANVIGTDLSKYKRVEQGQFAFNPMHVGRDEVLPIVLLAQEEPVIVSPAYVVFEVLCHDQLLPEYLMMWCRRPEFDRNAWFTTDSSVRGGFSWQNFCDMELPIPSIEKQREIVREYQTVVARMRLNERLNEKLEEAAQTIYKQWFVDFEFPITAEYAQSIGKPDLEGQPYKSSGGEMEYSKTLEQEIPVGFRSQELKEILSLNYGKSLPEHMRKPGKVAVFSSAGRTGWHNAALCEGPSVVVGRKGSIGTVYYVDESSFCIDTAYYIGIKDTLLPLRYVFTLLKNLGLAGRNEDSAVPGLNRNTVYSIPIAVPDKGTLENYSDYLRHTLSYARIREKDAATCANLAAILLSKMVAANYEIH